ncbi:hypothetical protein [Streptacidiphilus sp. PAMC 29251]
MQGDDVKLTWNVTEQDIGSQVHLNVLLRAGSQVHQMNGESDYDAVVIIKYDVLPPLEAGVSSEVAASFDSGRAMGVGTDQADGASDPKRSCCALPGGRPPRLRRNHWFR